MIVKILLIDLLHRHGDRLCQDPHNACREFTYRDEVRVYLKVHCQGVVICLSTEAVPQSDS